MVGSVTELGFLEDSTVDFAFASNLFEHLRQEDLVPYCSVVAETGTRRYAHDTAAELPLRLPEYDDTPISLYIPTSVCATSRSRTATDSDAKPRFLPLTIKSRLPARRDPRLPGVADQAGKQMLIRAQPRR